MHNNFLLYNSLTNDLYRVAPSSDGVIKVYTCGPTVYDYAHIGNMRTYVVEDILVRMLRWLGYKVFHVMNITDVDDKTIRKSREAAVSLLEYVKKYEDEFFSDILSINNVLADRYPRATDFINEMIEMIKVLLMKGFAYVAAGDGIYYKIDAFDKYGELSGVQIAAQDVTRAISDEYNNDSVADFALWKFWNADRDGDVFWDSPWGKGRPGWHLECSAMAIKLLGEEIDIHAGGVDNMFPHHENEIAQSEACTNKTFVKCWLHVEHLLVGGAKMSKSKGNFFTVRQLLNEGWSGQEIRLALMKAHYKSTLNFSVASLQEARKNLYNLRFGYSLLSSLHIDNEYKNVQQESYAKELLLHFSNHMLLNLNVPAALSVVFDSIRFIYSLGNITNMEILCSIQDLFNAIKCVLGIDWGDTLILSKDVLCLLEKRKQARLLHNWHEADAIREQILALGFGIVDREDDQICFPI